ncbi:MAG TPA: TonB-dependent receptor [Gammaproteobacteria bacterium]
MSDYLGKATACVLSSAALLGQYAAAQGSDAASAEAPPRVDTIIVVGSEMTRRGEVAELAVTPGGADLVDVARLQEQNVASLADLLRYSPGVWAVSHNGSDGIFFSSRGSNLDATDYDMNGIKLMQDGLPVTAADGNNHNRIIDPLAASYAVVVRGANALKYGASTLGGAVNFASPTARDVPPVGLSVRAGSHGEQLTRATLGMAEGAFDGLLTFENKRWDGYRDHNEQHRSGLYANGGWHLAPRIATRFYGTLIENDQELPGSLTRAQVDADPDQANRSALTGNFQLNVDTRRIANKTTFQIDEDRQLEFGFSVEEQSLYHPIVDVRIDFDGPGPAPEVQVFSLLVDTDHRDIGGVVRYNQRIGNHDVLLGANYGENKSTGGDYENLNGMPNGLMTIIDNDADSLEAFAMDRWRLDERLLLILAAQGVSADRNVRNTDAASGDLSNPHDSYSRINPQLGLIYDATSDLSVYANLSALFEPPTNFQLQDNVAGGDATLDAMHGTVAEVGVRGELQAEHSGDWSWSASVYYAQIEDEILSVDDPSAPGTSLVTNVDETVHAGIEAALSSRIGVGAGFLEPFVSFTLNDFSFDSDAVYGDAELPAAPEYVLRGELIYRSPSGFHIGPTLDIVGERFADFANTYVVDSYVLYGLRAGWENQKWRVFADLRNLGDEDYIGSHGVRDIADSAAAILNPGEPRSVYVGFEGRFE